MIGDFKFLFMVLAATATAIGFVAFMQYTSTQFVIERTVKKECLNEVKRH